MTDKWLLMYQGLWIGFGVIAALWPFPFMYMIVWRWYNRPKVRVIKPSVAWGDDVYE